MFSAQNSAGTSARRLSLVTLAAAVMLVVVNPGVNRTARAQVTRSLSSTCYVPEDAITVTITVPGSAAGEDVEGAALVDLPPIDLLPIPPVGWIVSAVSDSRCFADESVVNCTFDLLPSDSPTTITITYEVTPPMGQTGQRCWRPESQFNVDQVPTFFAVDCLDPCFCGNGTCDSNEDSCTCSADCVAGDSNNDGTVDFIEVGPFLTCFTNSKDLAGFPGLKPGCVTFDFDCDGDVDFVDVGLFLQAF